MAAPTGRTQLDLASRLPLDLSSRIHSSPQAWKPASDTSWLHDALAAKLPPTPTATPSNRCATTWRPGSDTSWLVRRKPQAEVAPVLPPPGVDEFPGAADLEESLMQEAADETVKGYKATSPSTSWASDSEEEEEASDFLARSDNCLEDHLAEAEVWVAQDLDHATAAEKASWASWASQSDETETDSLEAEDICEDDVEGKWAKRQDTRQRQVQIGKALAEYQRYVEAVPVEAREPNHPGTPDGTKRVSKRQFDRELSEWKRKLHLLADQESTDTSAATQPRGLSLTEYEPRFSPEFQEGADNCGSGFFAPQPYMMCNYMQCNAEEPMTVNMFGDMCGYMMPAVPMEVPVVPPLQEHPGRTPLRSAAPFTPASLRAPAGMHCRVSAKSIPSKPSSKSTRRIGAQIPGEGSTWWSSMSYQRGPADPPRVKVGQCVLVSA